MNTDLYTKTVLTVIAGSLLVLTVQHHSASSASPIKALDVNIVGVKNDLPVAIQSQKSDSSPKAPLEVMIVGSTKELPVAIQPNDQSKAPLEVMIVGATKDLPVAIQNQKTSESKGPREVKLVGVSTEIPVTVQNQPRFNFSSGALNINIKQIADGSLSSLPVSVMNTVDTNIKEPTLYGSVLVRPSN